MKKQTKKNKKFTITKAQLPDATAISSLYKQVLNDYRDKFPIELLSSRQPSPKNVVGRLQSDTYFVARVNNQIVGVVGCSIDHCACLLKHMVVDQHFRRQGIGKALTKRVIDYAKTNKANKVWLDTLPLLIEAKSLYKKMGFTKSGLFKRHFWGADVEFHELLL